MTIALATPDEQDLVAVLHALREWQHDGLPVQLHPGDVGWAWQVGAHRLSERIRTWTVDGRIAAVGMLDGHDLLRLAIAPEADDDTDLAGRLHADLADPARRVLPAGTVCVEARFGAALRCLLRAEGWQADEPWAPLTRDLGAPVEECGLRVEVVGADQVGTRTRVQRASFERSTFTEERWHSMAAGPAYADARCLIGYDDTGRAVAMATVWSAGIGRPGLLEPVGVHLDHRRRGYGRAISTAAAAVLRDLGASSATVCTPSDNAAAVGTYVSAGFRRATDVPDFRRDG